MIVRVGAWALCVLVLAGCQKQGALEARAEPPSPPVRVEATQTTPASAKGSSASAELESHQFYGVYVTGQKAGWAEERIQPLPSGGVRLVTRVELRVKRLGNDMKLTLTDEVEYGPPPQRALVAFRLEEDAGAGKAVREGRVEGDRMKVTVTVAGQRTDQVLDAPKETAADTLPPLLVPRLLAAGDAGIQVWQYDRQSLQDTQVHTRLIGQKDTRIQGVPVTVLEIKGVDKSRGLVMNNRITRSGRTLEMTIGAGLKLVLEDEAVARNPSVVVPDLYRLSVVPVDRPLGNPGSVSKLVLTLHGLPEDDVVSLDDARQKREGAQLTVHRRGLAQLPTVELTAEERKKWLASDAFNDHESEAVRAAAKRLAKGETDLEKVASLVKGVHSALQYTLATAPLSASAILASGKGDCTEYARVLVSILRSLGMPAREVSGMAWAGDADPGFAFHAWVEVYVRGAWLAVDPTWNQAPVDATHIALSRDDPAAIVGVLGGLRASVVAIHR